MIQIHDLSKRFGSGGAAVDVLAGIELDVPHGSLFTLLGPSGCGKTTTLRCVAGLEKPTAGEIRLNRQVVYSSGTGIWVPAERRDVGMVFQSYAIWPHMTVLENVVYPLDAKRVPKAEKLRRARDILEKVGLAELAGRPSTQLSGGQQQRVALARALVAQPDVLLFDEPLSNLDANLREQLRAEIVSLQKEYGITALYVTHDQEEALAISDRIAIMRGGRILETGDALSLYETPACRFSASFLGLANFVDGRIAGTAEGGAEVVTAIGVFRCRNPHRLPAGADCHVFFRPENVAVHGPGGIAAINGLPATVLSRTYLGHGVDIRFQVGSEVIRARVAGRHAQVAPRDTVTISMNPGACMVLARDVPQDEAWLAVGGGQ